MGPGRLCDLQRRRRDGPGLPELPARSDRLHRERFRGENHYRRGPGAACKGAPGAGEDAEPRAHRRHQRLRRAAPSQDGHDVGDAPEAGTRERRRAPEHARRARGLDAPDRPRDDRVHVRHHRAAEGRHADARQSRRRRERLEAGDSRRGGMGPSAVPPARPFLRAARVVPRRRARAHDGVRGEPGQGRRESERDAAPLHLQRAARLREGLRQDPRRGRGGSRRRSSTGPCRWDGT